LVFVAGGAILSAALGCQAPEPESKSRVAEAGYRNLVVTATAAGVVEPITTVDVKSKASGEITEVLVQEGDHVRRGQLLIRVDPRIPTNAVVQAEADSVVARAELDNAEAQLRRSIELHRAQAITDLELESARLARATAYAALIRARRTLEDAKIALEDTEVRAPGSGVVLQRAVEVGTVITSASRDVGGGAVLLRMAALDTVQVRALVDETDIGPIDPGTRVTIRVAAFPNQVFEGKVNRMGAEGTTLQNVTMFPVLTRIANRGSLLRPGMNAEVEIHIGEVQNALTVPNAALRSREDALALAETLGLAPEDILPEAGSPAATDHRYVVFVMENGEAKAVPVRTGLTDFDFTVVESGLEAGDTVLVMPTTGLLEEWQRREQWARDRAGNPLGGRGR
jgi:HlyD family secretion protein